MYIENERERERESERERDRRKRFSRTWADSRLGKLTDRYPRCKARATHLTPSPTAPFLRSEQRDPNPHKNSLIRNNAANVEWNP